MTLRNAFNGLSEQQILLGAPVLNQQGSLLTPIGSTYEMPVLGASVLTLFIKAGGTIGGAFVVEGLMENGTTDWVALQGVVIGNTPEISLGAPINMPSVNSFKRVKVDIAGLAKARIRVTTALGSAMAKLHWSVSVIADAPMVMPVTPTSYANQVSISGSVSIAGIIPTSPATSGQTILSFESAATTNSQLVKSGSTSLYELTLSNPTATAAFLKLYNKTGVAPVVGTDTPVATIPIPANSFQAINFGVLGKRFPTGLGLAITALMPKTDTGVAVAGIQVQGMYV